jgi:hypothetical protein
MGMVVHPEEQSPRGTMGRRRRRWREPAQLWWPLFAALGFLSWYDASWRIGLFTLALWCFYQIALIPAECRVVPLGGQPCAEPVRGRPFGCGKPHQAIKTDALWQLVRMRNPGRGQPTSDPNRVTGQVVWSPDHRGDIAWSDRRMLMITGIGILLAVAGAAYGLVA